MLHPITAQIAEQITGYIPFSEEEACEQFQTEITYDPSKFDAEDEDTHPVNGSVYRDKQGVLRCYWKPQCTEEELEGWYDVPTNEEIEEWSFDSVCFTPGDDEVEPDHPDSWLSILGLI